MNWKVCCSASFGMSICEYYKADRAVLLRFKFAGNVLIVRDTPAGRECRWNTDADNHNHHNHYLQLVFHSF